MRLRLPLRTSLLAGIVRLGALSNTGNRLLLLGFSRIPQTLQTARIELKELYDLAPSLYLSYRRGHEARVHATQHYSLGWLLQ